MISHIQARLWLEAIGANVVGIVPVADWQAYLPVPAQAAPQGAILIFGAGGPDFLRRYQAHAAAHGELEYWLADYAQVLFAAAFGDAPDGYMHPYRSGLRFPFQRAAAAAGLGVLGLNHVVLHPEWGPWFSLLGALILNETLPATQPTDWNPCLGCAAPCWQACPSAAVSEAGYDGQRCIATKLSHHPCLHACLARHACVVRADLRREMVQLEATRPRDDAATRVNLQALLASRYV